MGGIGLSQEGWLISIDLYLYGKKQTGSALGQLFYNRVEIACYLEQSRATEMPAIGYSFRGKKMTNHK